MENTQETGMITSEAREKLLAKGSFQSGRMPRQRIIVPTARLNNSYKNKKELGIELGEFFLLRRKQNSEEIVSLGGILHGVILKETYSVSSKFDPTGKKSGFYSEEFDSFTDDIKVMVSGSKGQEVYFEGPYGQFKEEHQDKNGKNDYKTTINLYVLNAVKADGEDMVMSPDVFKLVLTGKGMTEYFKYVQGDRKAGIPALHEQGIYIFSHIHEIFAVEGEKPNGEPYWYVNFRPEKALPDNQLDKVVNEIQPELNEQLEALRERKARPVVERVAPVEEEPAQIAEGEHEAEEGEVRIEDVPF